jgi:2',3'-cyclic-nucleotide 2'-phosphodiesterase (5'-nucleotidase family)
LSVLEVINCLDIDYFTLGNHEFDFGAANVGELMEKSNFKWLGSNVRHADSKALFHRVMDTDVFDVNISNNKNKNGVEGAECDQSTVKSSDGEADDSIRVGVFGVCTQFTPMLSDPGDEVVFEDVFEHSERCVKALRQQHCNFIIALTHLELENDKRIAEALDIDVIIGSTYYLISSL